jgi:hypothetical protein
MEIILFNMSRDLAAMFGGLAALWIIGALVTDALLKSETQQNEPENEPEPTEKNEPTTSDN